MIPYAYHMVNMGGVDLAEANHTVVEGIFSKIEDALDDTGVLVLYNMYFAKIKIPPYYCNIVVEASSIYINDSIEVSANDEITVIGVPPPLEPVVPLLVDDNGVYTIAAPQSGYNPVTVALQFTELSTNANGVYTPESPSRGFSKVTVEVPQRQPVIEPLSVTENGTYTAPSGTDGYNPVSVSVPVPTPQNPYIAPVFNGLVTAYNAINGQFFQNDGKNQCMQFYEIDPGDYCVFLDQPVGNRYRVLYFNSKTFEDFEPYLDTIVATPTAIFQSDQNITGETELTGNGLKRVFFFTAAVSGVLTVGTDNLSTQHDSFLFKITT